MNMDDSARRAQESRVRDSPRWSAPGEDTCTDITRRFIPDEDDPTVRASPEFTEALLNAHGSYEHPVSARVNVRPTPRKSDARATRTGDEPSSPSLASSRWVDDASISIRMESLLRDDPAVAVAIAALRSGDRISGVVDGPPRPPPSAYALRHDDHTVVDWADGAGREDSQAGGLSDAVYGDEATVVDPAFATEWLPPAPRIPAEFARTTPPSPPVRVLRRASKQKRVLRAVKFVTAGALLTASSFLIGRMNYEPEFRARLTRTAAPLWQAAVSGANDLAERVRPQPAPQTNAPPPSTALPAAPPRVSTLSAKPASKDARATPEATAEPARKVFRIDELPLCEGARCDDPPAPKKGRLRRKAPR